VEAALDMAQWAAAASACPVDSEVPVTAAEVFPVLDSQEEARRWEPVQELKARVTAWLAVILSVLRRASLLAEVVPPVLKDSAVTFLKACVPDSVIPAVALVVASQAVVSEAARTPWERELGQSTSFRTRVAAVARTLPTIDRSVVNARPNCPAAMMACWVTLPSR
jgi:hypothetical protein